MKGIDGTVAVRLLFELAKALKSESGENPEYDRALVELCTDAAGLSMEGKADVARKLGINLHSHGESGPNIHCKECRAENFPTKADLLTYLRVEALLADKNLFQTDFDRNVLQVELENDGRERAWHDLGGLCRLLGAKE